MGHKLLKITGLTLGLLVAAAGAIWIGLMLSDGGGPSASRSTGESTIGGPFELVDASGSTVTAKDFRGQYMLVYFGYTYCPDVCPTALVDMSRALERLNGEAPDKAARVRPVFITVDPARDDPETMGAYVKNFHDRMVGLTGSSEQVSAAAKEYHVYYEKVQGDRPEGEYLMNHSSYIYLLGPDGKYIDHFTHKTKAPAIAESLDSLVES
jgi:protein SCO1/2